MAAPPAEESPQSVEEAGALLGAAITRYGTGAVAATVTNPPRGMPSSFATASPVPSSELLGRLHSLRSLLRSVPPQDPPLVAAPSLLAGVLMKLLGISSGLAAAPVDPARRAEVPPMMSTPIRRVWVQCVVLCHSLGEGLSGNARINLYGFVRDMIILAGLNPRTARALGGTRTAALEVISGVLEDPKLSVQLASWAYDVIQLCQRALKSSGNGEPTYRIAAVRTACSVAVASRLAFMKTRSVEGRAQLVLKGALEDKAIFEMVKLLKIAVQDKYPEVRSAAAELACLLPPLVINVHVKSPSAPDAQAASPTACLEDVMTLSFKNLDDESAHVAAGWAEALARCMSTVIEYSNQSGSERTRDRDVEGGDASAEAAATGRGGRKGVLPAAACDTVPKAMKYLVGVFIKVGGELSAPRAGGSFSVGGRAVRVGFGRALVHFMRLQCTIQSLGEGRGITYKEAILIILSMVGTEMESQLNGPDRGAPTIENLDASTVVTASAVSNAALSSPAGQQGRALFGQGPKVSNADACVARMLTNQVLRQGLSEIVAETTQLAIFHELTNLCINKQDVLKANQLQVILIEISHLFSTLGEATANSLEELGPACSRCLRHPDHGVRHEAAVNCAAMASAFPSQGRRMLREGVNAIQLEHAELMAIAGTASPATSPENFMNSASRFRFGRIAPPPKQIRVDESLKHQYAIHGTSLMVSMIVRDLPDLPGGLSMDVLDTVMSVSEVLISSLMNSAMRDGSPSGTCTCVRAGFGLICGALTTGPDAITKHIALVFGLWQRVANTAHLSNTFSSDHEMICVEAMLTSIVAFLKYCSELLLSIPDALSRTSLILEDLLPLFFSKGRLGTTPANPVAAARFDSAKASILEAFAWLPPGSYPMIADSVFGFAATHIQAAIQEDVECSILPSLISKEDRILDALSFSRATRLGQVGGARDLECDLIAISSDASSPGDRESAFSFLGKPTPKNASNKEDEPFLQSQVLGLLVSQKKIQPATVLHEVGTWRTPVEPSCSTKVRLVDAAIQAFAATFGLKSGKEQQKAMEILHSLVPPVYFQGGRADQDRSGKSKDSIAATTNVVAVLLSCVKTLPVEESTHDVPIGLGPTWMNKASSILLTILPSPSNEVRRAAAESLGFLATLGVKEDMHFLQSTLLHSLDEVVSGNQAQGQSRNVQQDDTQAGRCGGLLALGCMQRNTYEIKERRTARSRLRGSPGSTKDDSLDSLPTIQIMTRVLPYTSNYVTAGISFTARTFALHSFLMILEYSGKLKRQSMDAEDTHLLRKAVEIIDDNFLSAWTATSLMLDQGNESGKIVSEASFLAVLLRSMTFLTPSLYHLEAIDSSIAGRFSIMAMIINECYGFHPVVQFEALAFFEVLADHQTLLPPHSGGIKYDEHPLLCSIPTLMANISPSRLSVQPQGIWFTPQGCFSANLCLRATLKVLLAMSTSQIMVVEWSDMKVVSLLFAALEGTVAATRYACELYHRGLAAPREAESVYEGGDLTSRAISDVLCFLVYLELALSRNSEPVLLRFILLSRSLLMGNSGSSDDDDDGQDGRGFTVSQIVKSALAQAASDSVPVFELVNPMRWQVKTVAVRVATIALIEFSTKCRQEEMDLISSPNFNPKAGEALCLNECRVAHARGTGVPQSLLSLHIADLVTAACVAAISTVDQVELRILQDNSMHCLVKIIDCFGPIPDPDQPDVSVLHEYIPQVSSCIKSSLVAVAESNDELTCRLFWVGCDALRSFLASKVSDDKGVIKRVIRPAMLSKSEVPFFTVSSEAPQSSEEQTDDKMNTRAALLVKIGKIWTLSNIPWKDPDFVSLLEPEYSCLGVHAAGLAIDGARLLLQHDLSLCGRPQKPGGSCSSSGFFSFREISEIDDFVKAAITKTWASNGQSAIEFLARTIASNDTSADVCQACKEWSRLLVPFLFAGLYESVNLRNDTSPVQSDLQWARGLNSEETGCCCLAAIDTLAGSEEMLELEESWKHEIELCLDLIYKSILLPILVPQVSSTKRMSGKESEEKTNSKALVARSCELLKTLTVTFSLAEGSSLLLALLGPLDLLQKGLVDLSDDLVSHIVSASLSSVAGILNASSTPPSMVKAMISLVLSISKRGESIPAGVNLAVQELLKQCLAHDAVTIQEHSSIATEMAKSRNWATWTVVVTVKDGIAAEKSLIEMESALLNPSDAEEQMAALGAIRSLIQSVTLPCLLVGRITAALGAEVISVLQAYGTLASSSGDIQSRRTVACADCMKIVLAAYQQVSTDGTDEDVTEFLTVVFEALISLLRFNGLPNHPPPQGALSDPTIGRMCAQAITHVARTTPLPFKASLGMMSDQDRAVLEFAVRAELSGYVAEAATAPPKKKLSLKGFKK